MNRRDFIHFSAMTGIGLLAGQYGFGRNNVNFMQSGKYIKTIEGEIIHVCPVKGQKMKLKLADQSIMKVIPKNDQPFSKEWNHRKVKIEGIVTEYRLSLKDIKTNYKAKKLLCHIDHTPCMDNKWIQNRWADGSEQSILDRDNESLNTIMGSSGKNYVTVYSIVPVKITTI